MPGLVLFFIFKTTYLENVDDAMCDRKVAVLAKNDYGIFVMGSDKYFLH